MKLYLDDLRPCPEGFTIARTVEEAIDIYKKHALSEESKIISLDHDLGGLDGTYKRTGYDFCKWLVEEYYNHSEDGWLFPDIIYLHTSNPVGRNNMFQLLERYAPSYTFISRAPMPHYESDGSVYKEDIGIAKLEEDDEFFK
jgi:hypothetical protein